jgi:hypothetical protein
VNQAQPRLGEFLAAAHRELKLAVGLPVTATPGRDIEEISQGLLHLTTVLGRFTADLTRTISQLPGPQIAALGGWDRAGIQADSAIGGAISVLGGSRRVTRPARRDAHCEAARHLHTAASALGAGRDLLQGHFSTDPAGARLYHSGWALSITSPFTNRALLTELAGLSRHAAMIGPALPRQSGTRATDLHNRLNTACQWLHQIDECVQAADRRKPATRAGREFLDAIPANALAPPADPDATVSSRDLCAAIISTAERARHLAWPAARLDPRSPAISVMSWRRIAAASTVTSHHCNLLCAALAAHPELRDMGSLSQDLDRAAEHARHARQRWIGSARKLQRVSTDTSGYLATAAAEAADLAYWTGRLTYTDPVWSLTSGPHAPTRPASSLVPQLEDAPTVVAAIHQAAETLSSLAILNREQIAAAIRAQRLLVPSSTLPEKYDTPRRFAVAPADHAASLLTDSADTANTAATAADATAEIAIRLRAPSWTVATARTAVRQDSGSGRRAARRAEPPADREDQPLGPVEARLRDLGHTDPRHLWRATAIDHAAQQVIDDAAAGREQRQRNQRLRRALATAQRGGVSSARAQPAQDLSADTGRSTADGPDAAAKQLQGEDREAGS